MQSADRDAHLDSRSQELDPRTPDYSRASEVRGRPMPLQLDPQAAETVRMLKEALETGRAVILQASDHGAPLSGCVSHIHEGAAAGEYGFSAFVGKERIVIGGGGDQTPKH